MAEDDIRYDLLTQEALRGVIRKVLAMVQRSGLPGQHHLYIAFDTEAEGVVVSKRLKDQYPDEMTIVLQYQFWDLQVTNERFEVKLSFGSVPERLVVPFQAVKAFYDPSAQFGLQFGKQGAANDVARQHLATAMPDLVADAEELGQSRIAEPRSELPPLPRPAESAPSVLEGEGIRIGAEVVHLDRFRKK